MLRRRGGEGEGMGDDPLSNRLRHNAKRYDTPSTIGALIVEITSEGPEPWVVYTNTRTIALGRADPVQDLPGPLNEKMVFIYQSDRHPDLPGWLVAVDRDLCIHEGLGNMLFITDEGKALRNALAYANAGECRWVSTSEREQRQRGLW